MRPRPCWCTSAAAALRLPAIPTKMSSVGQRVHSLSKALGIGWGEWLCLSTLIHHLSIHLMQQIHPVKSMHHDKVKIFAPNIEQRDVVDHLKGSPADEKRNVLVESARLARGNIQDLADLKVGEFDAVIFPGGFGVAKNLCSWAVDGKNCTINEHVNSTLQAFHTAKKPIGLCCISPVLAAKVFPGCEVTVGQDKNIDGRFPDAETASAIAELGCSSA
uniref:Glutamine amidotransferase-like class 1 domain-containing protein 3A, mitochondrial n=1 Tax=Chrysolophus pictus TaxID=9089 RepID=A0A8C3KVK3_CHRPC